MHHSEAPTLRAEMPFDEQFSQAIRGWQRPELGTFATSALLDAAITLIFLGLPILLLLKRLRLTA